TYVGIRKLLSVVEVTFADMPDIMFVVCACARFQVTPKVSHLYAVKRIFRYLKGQPKLALWYTKDLPFDLEAYTDSDYAGASLDRKSTTGETLTQFHHPSSNPITMSTLKFAETHNLVAFLEKPTESKGFNQIIDFLNANPIKYALTVNPKIYTSCIKQFWATAKVNIVNGEEQIQALVDKKKVIITETSVRIDIQLKDDEGTKYLPNATIFEQLTLMGYENLTQKLTFIKLSFHLN
nr:hypothetical protein [Tanacetum cinerariifolium]